MSKIDSMDKIDFSREAADRVITAMIAGSPYSAARYGLFDLLWGLSPHSRSDLEAATRELRAELGVTAIAEIPVAVAAIKGRPPRRVERALRSRELVDPLTRALDEVLLFRHSDRVRMWLTADLELDDLDAASNEQRHERRHLAGLLLARVRELLTGWQELGRAGQFKLTPSEAPPIDGRVLVAAARAWRVPDLVKGTEAALPPVTAASAKHANRLGRTAAAVAASRLPTALRAPTSCAPSVAVEEAFALLVAIAEAVSQPGIVPGRPSDEVVSTVMRGELAFSVRLGAKVEGLSTSMSSWWSVLDAWGTTSRKVAGVVPTAWKLSAAEGDVALWALCSAACRLALAAEVSAESMGLRPSTEEGASLWDKVVATRLHTWEAGAMSVWTLLQSTRGPSDRSVWPAAVFATPGDESSWPWAPAVEEAGTLASVPATEEG